MQTVYGVNELAERWGLSPRSIRQMEQDGKIHRLPDMPGVKYSAAEIHQLESVGREAAPLTPWERKNLEAEIRMRDEIIARYEKKFTDMMMILMEGRKND